MADEPSFGYLQPIEDNSPVIDFIPQSGNIAIVNIAYASHVRNSEDPQYLQLFPILSILMWLPFSKPDLDLFFRQAIPSSGVLTGDKHHTQPTADLFSEVLAVFR